MRDNEVPAYYVTLAATSSRLPASAAPGPNRVFRAGAIRYPRLPCTFKARSIMHSLPKTLFDFPFSGNGYKVRLALTQLGFPFEYRIVDLLAGAAQRPEFLALTPMGQVPVLQLVDGTALWESNAILFWLTEGTHLMPPGRLERARVVQWLNFE